MANEVQQPENYQQLLQRAAELLLQRGNDLFTCLDVHSKQPLTQTVPQTPVSSPVALLPTANVNAGAEEKTENQHEDLADDFFELV